MIKYEREQAKNLLIAVAKQETFEEAHYCAAKSDDFHILDKPSSSISSVLPTTG
jgi:hypothetical protein